MRWRRTLTWGGTPHAHARRGARALTRRSGPVSAHSDFFSRLHAPHDSPPRAGDHILTSPAHALTPHRRIHHPRPPHGACERGRERRCAIINRPSPPSPAAVAPQPSLLPSFRSSPSPPRRPPPWAWSPRPPCCPALSRKRRRRRPAPLRASPRAPPGRLLPERAVCLGEGSERAGCCVLPCAPWRRWGRPPAGRPHPLARRPV